MCKSTLSRNDFKSLLSSSAAVEETDCTRCVKSDVCKFKEEFLNVCDNIGMCTIPLVDGGFKRLCDFDFIVPEKLHCKYCKTENFCITFDGTATTNLR